MRGTVQKRGAISWICVRAHLALLFECQPDLTGAVKEIRASSLGSCIVEVPSMHASGSRACRQARLVYFGFGLETQCIMSDVGLWPHRLVVGRFGVCMFHWCRLIAFEPRVSELDDIVLARLCRMPISVCFCEWMEVQNNAASARVYESTDRSGCVCANANASCAFSLNYVGLSSDLLVCASKDRPRCWPTQCSAGQLHCACVVIY